MPDKSMKLAALPESERIHYERIGTTEWELYEIKLNVHDDVALWSDNPRLQTVITEGFTSEIQVEDHLRSTPGYDVLRKSIEDIGQMEPIYVKQTNTDKYITIEGNTRVAVLRQLDRKHTTGKLAGNYRFVTAKVVPKNFDEKAIAILLAGIHVRGSGVRDWGRFIEAKFVYETVVGRTGRLPLMNQTELASEMGKSESWVARLKSAYEFAMKFVEHVDAEDNPRKIAAEKFSILEEISKARVIGSQLRDYNNAAFDDLREEVFEMVRNNAFKEYREARFLKEFHDDPDTWHQLKSGEKHVASKLTQQIQDKHSSPKAKIAGLPQLIRRSIERGEAGFDDEDVAQLQRAIDIIEDQVHEGIHPYRLALKKASRTLNKASRADVRDLSENDLKEFSEAYDYFTNLVSAHNKTVTV
jgi:ParB-like chromosome segregation protein Spo0J